MAACASMGRCVFGQAGDRRRLPDRGGWSQTQHPARTRFAHVDLRSRLSSARSLPSARSRDPPAFQCGPAHQWEPFLHPTAPALRTTLLRNISCMIFCRLMTSSARGCLDPSEHGRWPRASARSLSGACTAAAEYPQAWRSGLSSHACATQRTRPLLLA